MSDPVEAASTSLERVVDRGGHVWATLVWDGDRLISLAVPGATVDGAIVDDPLLGPAHRITSGDATTTMSALAWARPDRIPTIAAPAVLAPGAGSAIMNVIAMLAAAALATGQAVWAVLLLGFIVPMVFWFHMIGFVIYGHHTHVRVQWHDEKAAWHRAQPFVSTTVHLTFPVQIGALIHHIMEHTAHHVDMSIPLYKLKEAQKLLEHLLPGRIIVQRFSWRWYFETARACKLYDFSQQCWVDFQGRATSAPRVPAPSA